MKKLIIVIALLVVGAFVAMPYITGTVAQSASEQMVESANLSPEKNGVSEIVSYERGYGSTKSTFRWNPPAVYEDMLGGSVEYTCDGDHGVMSYDFTCHLSNFDAYTEFVTQKLGGKDPISLLGEVSLLGTMTQTLKLDAFSVTTKDETMNVKSGFIRSVGNKELTEFEFEGEFEGLSFNDGKGEMLMGPMDITGDMTIGDDELAFLNMVMGMDSVKFDAGSEGAGEIKGFKIDFKTIEQGDNLGIVYDISADSIKSLGGSSAAVDMANAQFLIDVDGLDRAVMADLNQQMQLLYQQGDEPDPQAMMALLPALEGLLKEELSFNMSMVTDYQAEPFKLNFDIDLIEKTALSDFMVAAYNPTALLDKLKANVKLNVPSTLLSVQPGAEVMIANNPLFNKKGNGYATDIVLEKDNVSLNGKTMSLPELMAIVMQAGPR